jgi:molybdopterin-containing oxidoreductase family iron-sulfur binding subunit
MSLIQIQGGGAPAPAKKYWQTLDELEGPARLRAMLDREFAAGAAEPPDGNSRRTVLKLMAASFGLAGLTACRRPVERILPFSRGVEDLIPGKPMHYATAMPFAGDGLGLLVEVHDGRPTKIEGNPDHPSSRGAASAFAQASVLNLYDPDRSKEVLEGGKASTWAKFEGAVQALNHGKGEGLRFLSGAISSPALEAVKKAVLDKYPQARWVEYEPFGPDNARLGAQLAFGQWVDAVPAFDKAAVILALDDDFLGLDAPTVAPTKQFAQGRRVHEEHGELNRLYAVEAQFSLTGAMAEHRLRMKVAEVQAFTQDLAVELEALPGTLRVLQPAADKRGKFLQAVAKDLKAHAGKCLVTAGPRQPAVVHAIVHAINQKLGNFGATVSFAKGPEATYTSQVAALAKLVEEIRGGQVKTLVMLGGNPCYTAPADLDFAANLQKVAVSIHLGAEVDETARSATWHLPEAHYLEAWGDVRSAGGAVAIQQPAIEPIFGGRSALEVAALVAGLPKTKGYEIVRDAWLAQWPAERREAQWREVLKSGVAGTLRAADQKVAVDTGKVAAAVQAAPKPAVDGIEVAFYPGSATYDGRFANNGWLQEAPDPITKITWGNAVIMSPATAKKLKLVPERQEGERVITGVDLSQLDASPVVTVSKGNLKIEGRLWVQPGHADDAVSVAAGYGRTEAGRVAKGIGFNAYRARTTAGHDFASGFAVADTGRKERHATTQKWFEQAGRPIVREASLAEYRKEPKVIEEMAGHLPPLEAIYKPHDYSKGYQWGMAIDLTSCTGCNACVVACVSENNIPVVGREQVLRGREMHWIRMDRYYTGDENDPQSVTQAMPCAQCENAPCENVCPVAATVHSPEGLNDMAYNRCVGTRYCQNNCPFKVRRFNYFNYHKKTTEIEKMAANPDVTVRMRGVMEKCTYCVQRIQEARIAAKTDGRREIRDGEIVTACQQTCPADAIVFGNINDPESRVSRLKKQERNYALLAELNIRPRTTYLAKLRNPNPELA